jgi:hypothetical protein
MTRLHRVMGGESTIRRFVILNGAAFFSEVKDLLFSFARRSAIWVPVDDQDVVPIFQDE